ncbi:MAG TPA: transketolase C-terminal domain-containing protein, partial [Segetibacter sp.]
FVKPLDEELLHKVFGKFNKIVTVEDGTTMGGFGSAVLEFMVAKGYKSEVKMLGIPDRIVEHGTPKELQRECGYDAQGIAETVRAMMKDKVRVSTLLAG